MQKELSNIVHSKSIPLEKYNYYGLGFKKQDLIDLIIAGEFDDFAILGGDILIFNEIKSSIEPSYSNWYAPERLKDQSFEDYKTLCKDITLNYLKNYQEKENEIVQPVYNSEVTAGF